MPVRPSVSLSVRHNVYFYTDVPRAYFCDTLKIHSSQTTTQISASVSCVETKRAKRNLPDFCSPPPKYPQIRTALKGGGSARRTSTTSCHSSPATHHPASSPNYCVPVTGHRACSASLRLLRLRSSGSDRLHVPVIRRSTVGSRTFTVCGAAVFNDLPAHVTAAPSLAVFRQRLKTFLYSRSYPDIVI